MLTLTVELRWLARTEREYLILTKRYVYCIISLEALTCVGILFRGKTTLVKLMAGELQPSLGDIRPHGHLKLGRFTQHFVDVLELGEDSPGVLRRAIS